MNFEVLSKKITKIRFNVITDINSTIADVVAFGSNLNWDHRCLQFLIAISKDIQCFSESNQSQSSDLENTMITLATFFALSSDHTAALRARPEIQLNVVRALVLCYP